MRPTRPAGAGNQGGPGSQQQVRQSAMNARPITGQSTGQPRPGMPMPQNNVPGRPQQPQMANMPQAARPGYNQYQTNRPPVSTPKHSDTVVRTHLRKSQKLRTYSLF